MKTKAVSDFQIVDFLPVVSLVLKASIKNRIEFKCNPVL